MISVEKVELLSTLYNELLNRPDWRFNQAQIQGVSLGESWIVLTLDNGVTLRIEVEVTSGN